MCEITLDSHGNAVIIVSVIGSVIRNITDNVIRKNYSDQMA
jgi:hypothetical protein